MKLFITKRISAIILLCTVAILASAQGLVKGKILDKTTDELMPYVSVVVNNKSDGKFVKGTITDESGEFTINELPYGSYQLVVTFLGYKDVKREFTLNASRKEQSYAGIYLSEDSRQLSEVTVTGQRTGVKLEVDRKSFDVSQDISNAGGAASDVLENIPSVEVDNDGNISLRGNSSVEVWINGKASGLTSDNRAQC